MSLKSGPVVAHFYLQPAFLFMTLIERPWLSQAGVLPGQCLSHVAEVRIFRVWCVCVDTFCYFVLSESDEPLLSSTVSSVCADTEESSLSSPNELKDQLCIR